MLLMGRKKISGQQAPRRKPPGLEKFSMAAIIFSGARKLNLFPSNSDPVRLPTGHDPVRPGGWCPEKSRDLMHEKHNLGAYRLFMR